MAAARRCPTIPMATITITDLHTKCRIGVTPEEREQPQEILLTLSLEVDASKAAASDKLADTVDYDALSKRVAAAAEGLTCSLIETLHHHIMDTIIAFDARIHAAEVVLTKPAALSAAGAVSLTDRRVR